MRFELFWDGEGVRMGVKKGERVGRAAPGAAKLAGMMTSEHDQARRIIRI